MSVQNETIYFFKRKRRPLVFIPLNGWIFIIRSITVLLKLPSLNGRVFARKD